MFIKVWLIEIYLNIFYREKQYYFASLIKFNTMPKILKLKLTNTVLTLFIQF